MRRELSTQRTRIFSCSVLTQLDANHVHEQTNLDKKCAFCLCLPEEQRSPMLCFSLGDQIHAKEFL